jgi:hypothetical protein
MAVVGLVLVQLQGLDFCLGLMELNEIHVHTYQFSEPND